MKNDQDHGQRKADSKQKAPTSPSSVPAPEKPIAVDEVPKPLSRYEKRSLWLTGGGMAVAICVLGVYYCQLKVMQNQLNEMKASNESQLRAWLGVSSRDVHLQSVLKEGAENSIGITYENSGKTPALNATIRTTSFYAREFPLEARDLKPELDPVSLPKVTIPPGGYLP